MFSQPCRLLFLAVLLAAGFFNSSLAQDTVPAELVTTTVGCKVKNAAGNQTDRWTLNDTGGATTGVSCVDIFYSTQIAPYDDDRYDYSYSVGQHQYCNVSSYSDPVCFTLTTVDNGNNGATSDNYYFAYPVNTQNNVQQCPSSHPIDNGDGTCSTDTAHEDWCQAVANGEWGNEGLEYHIDSNHALYGSVALCVTYDYSPWSQVDPFFNDDGGAGTGYSCVYEVDFHAETAGETWYRATNETCTRINDDNCPDGQRNCAATHVPGSDDGGGPGDGGVGTEPIDGSDLTPPNNPTEPTPPDPASSPEAENLTYLGEKFAFENRKQTDQIIEGLAQSVNQRNTNTDKNTDRILKGLAAVQKEIADKPVGGGGGTGDGDPAGWGNEEDVEIGAVDCLPDPITGRCTNWAPLTEQELPEKIYNLDDEIAQFDEYSVTASCPDTLDMNLSFGVFDFNSKPVCDTLGGVRYILLALAYFLVARVVTRSMA